MTPFENVEQPLVVVLGLPLGNRVHLSCSENTFQLLIVYSILEVCLQPCIECIFSLLKGETCVFRAEHLLELLYQLFSVLGNFRAYLFILRRVLPSGETRGLDAQLVASVGHPTEGLLPFGQVNQSILPDINNVEKVF